jgi:Fic family protein
MVRRISLYIHQAKDWPRFRWKPERVAVRLSEVRHRQGRLSGRMEVLGFPLRDEAVLQTLTEEVLKSSEIEGEVLDREQVRSSIARRLGLDIGGLTAADRNVEGVVEMTLDAAADELTRRLVAIFLDGPDGRRPVFGGYEKFQRDPSWHDLIPFHEYFHGDTGQGLGASHQTGWTGLVGDLIARRARVGDMPDPGASFTRLPPGHPTISQSTNR